MATSKKEMLCQCQGGPHADKIPDMISALPIWCQELYLNFAPLVGYQDMRVLGLKNPKSASTVFRSDPDAPKPIFIGREARFDRMDVVLWAFRRSRNAKRRGRSATIQEGRPCRK